MSMRLWNHELNNIYRVAGMQPKYAISNIKQKQEGGQYLN